jgi:hypothetical protein
LYLNLLWISIMPAIRRQYGNGELMSTWRGNQTQYCPRDVRRCWFETFPGRLVMTKWKWRKCWVPSTLIDLTVFYFLLWGHLKDATSRTVQSQNHWWEEVEGSCAAIPVHTLVDVCHSFQWRSAQMLTANLSNSRPVSICGFLCTQKSTSQSIK